MVWSHFGAVIKIQTWVVCVTYVYEVSEPFILLLWAFVLYLCLYHRSTSLSTVSKQAFPVSSANLWNTHPPHMTSACSDSVLRHFSFYFHIRT